MGSYQVAVDDCSKALELYPDFVNALWYRANAYRTIDQKEYEALADFERLLQLDPKNAAEYYQSIGDLNYRLERFEEAVKAYENYVALTPNVSQAFLDYLQIVREKIVKVPNSKPT